MGYPMTWQRILNRNGISFDKDSASFTPGSGWNLSGHTAPVLVLEISRAQSSCRALIDDLRRLTSDTVDERWICDEIYRRTGIEQDVVAAVLKEFMAI